MNIKRPIVLFLVSLICGMITIYYGIKPLDKIIILSVAFFMFLKLYIKNILNIKIISIVFLFFVLGIFRFAVEDNYFNKIDNYIVGLNNKQQTIYGRIENIGDNGKNNYFVLSNTKVNGYNIDKTKCYFPKEIEDEFKIGYLVKVKGKIYTHDKPMNFGEFNSNNYYRSIKETANIFTREIYIEGAKVNILKNSIFNIRQKIKLQIYKLFNTKFAGLFNAMITGDKSGLDIQQKRLFQDSGIAHILAISGLHLSIIGLALYELLRKKFSVNTSALVVSIFILLYAIFIDASFTTMRAIIMLYIKFLSLSIGRTYDFENTLFIVLFCFIIYSPYLIFNAGFQFSYVAVFALNYEYCIELENIRKIRKKYYEIFKIEKETKNINKLSISPLIILTIFLFPITVYNYFDYPLYSILINIIVVPLMTIVLYFGLIGVVFSFMSIYVGRFLVGIVHYIFILYEAICRFFEKMPFNELYIGKPKLIYIIIFYILLFSINYILKPKYFYNKNKNEIIKKLPNYRFPFVLFLLVIINMIVMGIHITFGLKFTSLYIGQGDSIIIKNKNQLYTIDGGSTSNTSAGKYILEPHLKARAKHNIDIAFITHADSDHTNCIEYLLENVEDINIKKIALPIMAENNNKYDNLKMLAKNREVDIVYLKAGDVLKFDDIQIYILNPIEGNSLSENDINEQSLCFKLVYDDKSIMFTGDIGEQIEYQLLNNKNIKKILNSDILKVAHHGSRKSSVLKFLQEVSPEYSIISAGINNSYNHPHKETISQLEQIGTNIIKTNDMGEIDITINNGEISIETFKK